MTPATDADKNISREPDRAPEGGDNHTPKPGPHYIVGLRPDVDTDGVVRLVRYVTDFGTGEVRGRAVNGGWSIQLSQLSDLRLLQAQYPDLVEGHSVLDLSRPSGELEEG